MSRFTWVVKTSKFCNMRCTYCYEYEELDKRERMSLDTWRDLFALVGEARHSADKRERASGKEERPSEALVVLHGGEPSLLPLDYLASKLGIRKAQLRRR